jgi:transposase
MERRTFTREFKKEAVQLTYDSDITVAQVAKNLGIRAELLYRWRAEQRQGGGEAFPGKGNLKSEDAELARLRRELEQTRMERDILKKALSVFAQPTR